MCLLLNQTWPAEYMNPSNPKYLEWYSLVHDLEQTIHVCGGWKGYNNAKVLVFFISYENKC